ncbi:MAG: transposase [Planctomycetaceae bacterium]|nr:transposase [Planctomycetaceae bacterium]
MSFELFDPAAEVRITYGHLPHWYQPGATYFVTFRTADSLPPEVADLLRRRRHDWLHRHGIDGDRPDWKIALRKLSDGLQRDFDATFSREFLRALDKGHGACPLRRRELAETVSDSLRHFDGERYHLGDFVVMPNHVHLLVGLLGTTEIEAQCYSWKKFTAASINRDLQQTGEFWQTESFDHLVRNAEQFDRIRRYIAQNGPQAGLSENEYLHWQRPLATTSSSST